MPPDFTTRRRAPNFMPCRITRISYMHRSHKIFSPTYFLLGIVINIHSYCAIQKPIAIIKSFSSNNLTMMQCTSFFVAFMAVALHAADAANNSKPSDSRNIGEDLSMPIEQLEFSMPEPIVSGKAHKLQRKNRTERRRLTEEMSMPTLEEQEFSMPEPVFSGKARKLQKDSAYE